MFFFTAVDNGSKLEVASLANAVHDEAQVVDAVRLVGLDLVGHFVDASLDDSRSTRVTLRSSSFHFIEKHKNMEEWTKRRGTHYVHVAELVEHARLGEVKHDRCRVEDEHLLADCAGALGDVHEVNALVERVVLDRALIFALFIILFLD